MRFNKSLDTDTQHIAPPAVLVSVRLAAQCHCAPVNSDVRPMLLEIPANTDDEPRYLVIGLIDGKHWSAVMTYRGANIRLISVRRARTEEVVLYES